MPRGDRTGPQGMGPMTGRGAGYCAGYNVPGFMNAGGGRFFGRGGGFGFGRGFRGQMAQQIPYGGWNAYPPPTIPYGPADPKEELDLLKQEAKAMENHLQSLKQQISEIESDKGKSK